MWLGRDPLSPPLDPHMFMYLSICINPFIRNCVWKLKLKSIRGASTLVKNSYETKVTHNERNDAIPMTNPLPASSFNSLHAEAWWHHSENPWKRRSQKETNQYICTRSAHFFCFPQLTFQRMLISDKIPVSMYNVEPDKISRIMYLIWSHVPVLKCYNGKWAIAWENLSFGIGFTEEASGSIIHMRGSRDPGPPPWKFTSSILTFAPHKPLIPLFKTVKKLMPKKRYQSFFWPPPPWRKFLDPRMILP